MKNLLIAVIAVAMTSAMAHHSSKHMITFGGFDDGSSSQTFDFSHSTEDKNGAETSQTNVALNYTYAFTGSFMAGAKYMNNRGQGNDFHGYGIQAFYNLNGEVNDTCYVGLHYTMKNYTNDDKGTDIALEYGHRFSVGSWMGMHLTFSPSVSYTMSTKELDAGGDDEEMTHLGWNWLKFDVLF